MSRPSDQGCESQVRFLACMDEVNRIIQQSDDVEQMLWDVLAVVRDMFDCDRIWLFYPCDPQAPIYRIPVEVTRPEYPGAHALNLDVPMKPGGDLICAKALAAQGPVIFDADSDPPVFPELSEQFGVQSQMVIALYPRVGRPWMLGMHQCSHRRDWNRDEQALFEGLARRIGDGLSTLLLLRDLRESQERFDLAVQGSRDGLMDWPDTKRDAMWWSPRTFELLGYVPEEVPAGLSLLMTHIHPEDRERVQAYLDAYLKNGQGPFDVDGRILTKSGEVRWLWARSMAVRDAAGRVRRMSGSLQDITEQKRAEEQLRLYREQLEDLVTARTAKLKRINAELEAANKELEAFSYSVSHDLRTPLAPIIGFAEILAIRYGERLDERARGMLTDIVKQGEKMNRLIEDLLSLARVGHDQAPEEFARVDEVLDEALDTLAGEFPEVRDRVRRPPSWPSARIHRALLHQVFVNLLGNALRYAGATGAPIEMEGERRGRWVRFCVRDHGPGIPREEQGRVFSAFYRGTQAKEAKGSGIGLAIVLKIARRYGGTAWVEDTPGGGCTFVVEMDDSLALELPGPE
ncbi:ATP-binding protein [Geoalkalibacter halelectricus]|uniref:ATP-binding protein n=1 Tax=Geoalkalibacter halelectricus TaxID=2847045 RepID=UPI003D1A949D